MLGANWTTTQYGTYMRKYRTAPQAAATLALSKRVDIRKHWAIVAMTKSSTKIRRTPKSVLSVIRPYWNQTGIRTARLGISLTFLALSQLILDQIPPKEWLIRALGPPYQGPEATSLLSLTLMIMVKTRTQHAVNTNDWMNQATQWTKFPRPMT